jgi:hypothetical protein
VIAARWAGDDASPAQVNDLKNQFIAANPQLSDPNRLAVGQPLNFPGAGTVVDDDAMARARGSDTSYLAGRAPRLESQPAPSLVDASGLALDGPSFNDRLMDPASRFEGYSAPSAATLAALQPTPRSALEMGAAFGNEFSVTAMDMPPEIASGLSGPAGLIALPIVSFGAEVGKNLAAAKDDPEAAAWGASKRVINFGPDSWNSALDLSIANSPNILALRALEYGGLLPAGTFDSVRDFAHITPLAEISGRAEAGGSLLFDAGMLFGPALFAKGAALEEAASSPLFGSLRAQRGAVDLDAVFGNAEPAGIVGVPINGATRTVPLSFNPPEQFATAAQQLQDALVQSGITDATVGVRGSSVTGVSLTKGTPFGPRSDIDFFIESEQLTNGYKTSKNIPGFVHPGKILPDYPLLRDWSATWTNTLGRDVTPGAFVPGTLPSQPSIVVRPIGSAGPTAGG